MILLSQWLGISVVQTYIRLAIGAVTIVSAVYLFFAVDNLFRARDRAERAEAAIERVVDATKAVAEAKRALPPGGEHQAMEEEGWLRFVAVDPATVEDLPRTAMPSSKADHPTDTSVPATPRRGHPPPPKRVVYEPPPNAKWQRQPPPQTKPRAPPDWAHNAWSNSW